jgi:hypothetical protein
MVDPITKSVTSPALDSIAGKGESGSASPKTGESKFDKVRSNMQDRQAQQVELPPEVNKVSLAQQQALKADLSQRMTQAPTASAQKLFAVDMKRAKEGVQKLTSRVDALPKTPAFQPFRDRLASIDSQFQSSGQLLNSIKSGSSPQDLMKVQMQMYQLNENLELMSKVVEQVTTGMKSILQTQV